MIDKRVALIHYPRFNETKSAEPTMATPFDVAMYPLLHPSLLSGKDEEYGHPEMTIAAGIMTKHPLIRNGSCHIWGDYDIQDCPQGIFYHHENGEEIHTALISAYDHKTETTIVLYAKGYASGTCYGYFETEKIEDNEYRSKIKGNAIPVVRDQR